MCFCNKRITVLLGAGVPLNLKSENDFFPSTKNITNKVLNTPYKTFDLFSTETENGTLIKDIYIHLCEEYHPALNPDDEYSAAKVHFEILFYILEMLSTYERSNRETTESKYIYKFAPFIELTKKFKFNPNEFYSASRHLIDTIIKCVRMYDDVFGSADNDW